MEDVVFTLEVLGCWHIVVEVVEEVDTVTSGFSEEVRVLFGRQRVCRGGGDLEW